MSGHVVIIHPDDRVTVEDTVDGEPGLGQLQKAVDGYIEIVSTFDTLELSVTLCTYMDEASVRRLLPLTRSGLGPQRCIAFCNEDGKPEGMAFNMVATQLWAQALVRNGQKKPLPQGGVVMDDFLVGPIALLIGDDAIAAWTAG